MKTILLATALALAVAKPPTTDMNGDTKLGNDSEFSMSQIGKAPKFRITDGVKGTRDLMISFDGLEEVDSTGAVMMNGRKIASLASKNFTISFPDEFSVEAKLQIDANTFSGAKNLKCSATATQAITADSSVIVSGVYNPAEKVVSVAENVTMVVPKGMKWSIDVKDWPTCFGDRLDLEMSIKSGGSRAQNHTHVEKQGPPKDGPKAGQKFDAKKLPEGAKITADTDLDGVGAVASPILCTVNGNTNVAISVDVNQKDGKTTMIYHLPLLVDGTVSRSIHYDPVITLGSDADDGPTQAPGGPTQASPASALSAAAFLGAFTTMAALVFMM